MHFWIFENFLKIFGNLRKSSEIFRSSLKLFFLSYFASFENFYNARGPYKICRDPRSLQTTYQIAGNNKMQ